MTNVINGEEVFRIAKTDNILSKLTVRELLNLKVRLNCNLEPPPDLKGIFKKSDIDRINKILHALR